MWHIDDIVEATGGLPYEVTKQFFDGVSTDSRTIREGEIFVPLAGPRFDGHLFIEEAMKRSQGGYVCERKREEVWRRLGGTAVLVEDAPQALLDLARYKRKRSGSTFVAITGSNGKTTTKEILVGMAKEAFSVAYNERNLNNLVGVPNSMLSFDGEAEICILELGTNARGEIGRLARAVDPDLSLITNIRPSHLEGLGDMAGVLEEKLDLFRFTGEGGKIFVNADDPLLLPGAASLEREAYTFSLRGEADFRLSVVENRGWDGYDIEMILREDTVRASTGLLGEHNLYNILAASAIAWTAGVDTGHIAAALRDFVPYAMRFSPRMAAGGYLVVDDTYNANPASMASALEAFQALPCRGRRMAVLADMQELGEEARRYHRELGRFLKGGSLWKVFLLGDLVGETLAELGGERGLRFDNKADMVAELRSVIGEGDAVLVKGSRLSRLEEVVEALR